MATEYSREVYGVNPDLRSDLVKRDAFRETGVEKLSGPKQPAWRCALETGNAVAGHFGKDFKNQPFHGEHDNIVLLPVLPIQPGSEPGSHPTVEFCWVTQDRRIFADRHCASLGDIDMESAAFRAVPALVVRLSSWVVHEGGRGDGPRLATVALFAHACDDKTEESIFMGVTREVKLRFTRVGGLYKGEAGRFAATPCLAKKRPGRKFCNHVSSPNWTMTPTSRLAEHLP